LKPARIRISLVFPFVTLMALAACREPVPEPVAELVTERSEASVRDSAGVTIVENESPWWQQGEAWTVGPDPDLRLGTASGDDRYVFERVIGAATLSDGRIVVADAGGPRLKLFDAAGGWLRDVGRRGEGPGEFGGMNILRRTAGDSVFVFDWSGHRYTVYSPDFEVGRVTPLRVNEPGIGPPHIKAITGDGTPILIAAKPPWVEEPMEWYGQPGHMFVEAGPGEFSGEVARFPGQGNLWKTLYATLGNDLVVVSTGRFAADIVDLTGQRVRSIRLAAPSDPIPPEFFESKSSAPRPSLVGVGETVIALTAEEPDPSTYPASLPAVDAVLVDPGGHLWLRRFVFDEEVPETGPFSSPSGDANGPQSFAVFRPDGQWLGDVAVPAGVDVLEVGERHLLGIVLDEYDVQYLVRYPIVKLTPGGG